QRALDRRAGRGAGVAGAGDGADGDRRPGRAAESAGGGGEDARGGEEGAGGRGAAGDADHPGQLRARRRPAPARQGAALAARERQLRREDQRPHRDGRRVAAPFFFLALALAPEAFFFGFARGASSAPSPSPPSACSRANSSTSAPFFLRNWSKVSLEKMR